jgi:N-acetylneuraminate synthase/N,N'-diacetyllegionaminate synthase
MKKVIIIAEAGVNHNGDIDIAKKLIVKAYEAEVDYIKFQSFKANKLVSLDAKMADYQIKNTNGNDSNQFQMLKNLELSEDQHEELIAYCNKQGIKFFSTAFDSEGVKYLDSIGLELIKIPSGEITNFPYLRTVAKMEKPVIMSTGMSSLSEIEDALNLLTNFGLKRDQITVLHCNTAYPTPMTDVNLKAMNLIAKSLGVKIGYSDHTLGIEVSIAAVALGASVIEKHFTLDRNLPGPDHKASLEPLELKAMVKGIRNIEVAIAGDGLKNPSESELKNISIVRKSIHLCRSLKEGDIIRESDICALRPGGGISPMEWNEVIGKKLIRDTKAYDQLDWENIEG